MSIIRFIADPMSGPILNDFMADPFSTSYRSRRDLDRGEMVLTPRMDIYDATDSWRIHIDLPGVPKENVIAEMRGGSLHVEGQTGALKDYEKFKNVLGERRHGKYNRVISLPRGSDQSKIKAKYDNGVLKLYISKKEEPVPKKISVS